MAEAGTPQLEVGIVTSSSASRRRISSILLRSGVRVAARTDAAGVIVLHMPSLSDAVEQVQSFRRRDPAACIVCLIPQPVWKETRSLLREGASSVVAVEDLDLTLAAAVLAAHAGQLSLPSRLRQEIAQPVLSVREKQMLAMVVMGFTNPEISRKLHVAESTVKSHLSSAFAKLGVRSRNEATALILDPASGLGTGILEISGSTTHELASAPAA